MNANADCTLPIVELENVDFAYAQTGQTEFGLHVDHLTIQRGEHAACIGPSGTGKTTLIHLSAGILTPHRGSIKLGRSDIAKSSDAQRRAFRIRSIGLVFQEFELLEYLTAHENIVLPYHIATSLRLTASVRKRAKQLATSMRIDHVLHRNPKRLSQGERQRVAICRAMITQPILIIADEPTGNLDPETAALTLDLLFHQVDEQNATLLMVTHNHSILDRFNSIIDMTTLNSMQSIPSTTVSEL